MDKVIRRDIQVQMAGGQLMWLDFMLAPLRDGDGRITHLIPSANDITQRHASEEALQNLRVISLDYPVLRRCHHYKTLEVKSPRGTLPLSVCLVIKEMLGSSILRLFLRSIERRTLVDGEN